MLDAFSSDAVPVHLLTREAMALYQQKLAPGGLIGAHVMNRHMELASVVAATAAASGLTTRVMSDDPPQAEPHLFRASAAAMARSDADFGALLAGNWLPRPAEPTQRVWTDDYSNVVGAIWRRLTQ